MKAIVWSQFSDTEKIQLLSELVDDPDDAIRRVVAEWLERLQPADAEPVASSLRLIFAR